MIDSLWEILGGFLTGLAFLAGPPGLIALWLSSRRPAGGPSVLFFPVALMWVCAFFLVSGIVARIALPSAATLFAATTLAFLLCAVAGRSLRDPGGVDPGGLRPSTIFAIAFAFSTLAIADCVWVYCAQAWGYDGRPPHVLSPMQLDPQRNASIVSAISRGDIGVFLPGDPILYQLLWYRGAALLLTVLPASSMRYFQVGGLALLMGWAFYFVVLVMILRGVPRNAPKAVLLLLLCALLILDARIDDIGMFKTILSALHGGNSGVAIGYQYFSLKLLALTAPQHSLFLVLFATAVYFREIFPRLAAWRIPVWSILAVSAVVSSPVLAAFSMPPYVLADTLVHLRRGWRDAAARFGALCGVAVAAFVVHWVVIGFPPSDLFGRTDAIRLQTLWKDGILVSIRALPLVTLAICGFAAGVCIVAVLLLRRRELRGSPADDLYRAAKVMTVTSAIVFLMWNVVITDVELRRHSSMIVVTLLSLVCGMLATRTIEILNSGPGRVFVIALLSVGVALEFRFVDAYSSESATTISADIPWNDYFAANRYLETSVHPKGVIAASGEGVVLPIPNNVATTLAPKLAIIAHQRVSGAGAQLTSAMSVMGGLGASDLNRNWVRTAQRAGFDTVVWGPVEESMWGGFGRRILLDSALFKASFGEVGVFAFPVEGASVVGADGKARRAFLEKVACNAYIRKQLREHGAGLVHTSSGYEVSRGKVGSLDVGARLGEDLRAVRNGLQCDLSLLLVSAPSVPNPGQLGRELDLRAFGAVHQSSIRTGLDSHGPANAINPRPPESNPQTDFMAITETEGNPWWELDLGRVYNLAAVQIVRAVNVRLTSTEHIYVLISVDPFVEKAPEDPFKAGRSLFPVANDWPAGQPFSVAPARGRYIRIQADGVGYLALSRVRVWERTVVSAR